MTNDESMTNDQMTKPLKLRVERNRASDELMQRVPQSADSVQLQAKWEVAQRDFRTWHLWSLLLNMVTIALVTVAMAMCAALPGNLPATPTVPGSAAAA